MKRGCDDYYELIWRRTDNEFELLDDIAGRFLSEEIVEKLIACLTMLYQREGVLLEITQHDRKKSFREKVLIPIVTGVIGTVLGSVVTALLSG